MIELTLPFIRLLRSLRQAIVLAPAGLFTDVLMAVSTNDVIDRSVQPGHGLGQRMASLGAHHPKAINNGAAGLWGGLATFVAKRVGSTRSL